MGIIRSPDVWMMSSMSLDTGIKQGFEFLIKVPALKCIYNLNRLGTAEVEDALMEHEAIAEAAVVGFPHEVKGEGVYAYITLKEGYKDRIKLVENELKQLVKKKISGSDRKEILLTFNFSNIAIGFKQIKTCFLNPKPYMFYPEVS